MLVRPWLFFTSVVVLLASAGVYLAGTREGGRVRAGVREWFRSPEVSAERLIPSAAVPRTAVLYWLDEDGLWSAQSQSASGDATIRIEQLSNLVLDRLGLGLLVVQAIVSEEDVAFLFFSTPDPWWPSATQEAALGQSVTRTLLSDLPWLVGVRLLLPERHMDWGLPLRHFDRGPGPVFKKPRSTRGPGTPTMRMPGRPTAEGIP